jgi:hypothetical protein
MNKYKRPNRKKRKLKKIRLINSVAKAGMVMSVFKVSKELLDSVGEDVLTTIFSKPHVEKSISKRFELLHMQYEVAPIMDDFLYDMQTAKVMYKAIKKTGRII